MQKTFKLYCQSGSVFFRYKKKNVYLYHVDIFRYTTDENNSFRTELIDSGEFETNKFIGLESTTRIKSKNPNVVLSKEISLLAAPAEYIEKHNIKQIEDANQRKPKPNRSSKKYKNGDKKSGV